MTISMNEYVMTEATLNRTLVNRGITVLVCDHKNCDDIIVVGDKVVSKMGKNHRKIYHKKCWKKTFVG